ncbi:hypothetical protein NDU88_006192 [Pleurodeles waltl]|uniref:Uncharacterized protein n=1 Tax=Pleurodeles waltl TaxID=8319 RepID=A0AAV7QN95_PLEWA|nr:hypothetical protein NDU88_006192 [Pleurodeles waltl]
MCAPGMGPLIGGMERAAAKAFVSGAQEPGLAAAMLLAAGIRTYGSRGGLDPGPRQCGGVTALKVTAGQPMTGPARAGG